MACPKCGSSKVRVSEPGALMNSLVCMSCGHDYQKLSPVIKSVGLHMFAVILGGAIFDGSDGTFGDEWGGDGNGPDSGSA
jgi:uncharacterized protein (DUF983 family)